MKERRNLGVLGNGPEVLNQNLNPRRGNPVRKEADLPDPARALNASVTAQLKRKKRRGPAEPVQLKEGPVKKGKGQRVGTDQIQK